MSQPLQFSTPLIYGFAREGVSTHGFLRSHGFKGRIYVADDRNFENLTDYAKKVFEDDKNVELIDSSALDNNTNIQFDVLFLTPGKPLDRVPERLWPIVTSQTALFLDVFHEQTVGITGTKGKSTTSSLTYEILKASGKDAVLLGNIGKPPLDFFDLIKKDTVVVFELSSHQLSLVKNSPHIAIFLNFYPEHLDYYKSLDAYMAAKENITKFQSSKDHLVINETIESLAVLAKKSKAIVYPITIAIPGWPSLLVGEFNQLNIAAAWVACKILGVSEKDARQAVKNFVPLEHRLELVGTFKGITFYNDSISTIPETAIEALNTFGDQVETLIVGGFDRSIKYTQLAERIENSSVKNLVLFPTTGQKILEDIKDPGKYQVLETSNMEEAVRFAYQKTAQGKIAIMSPASTSFNNFKDFEDRGNQFKTWVVQLGK